MDERQLARIRLLSSRFLELQGLRVAFAGATIAMVFAVYLASTHPTASGGLAALALSFVLMFPGQWWAHQYYARTVGRQVPTPGKRWPLPIVFSVYFLAATYINRTYPAIPAGGPTIGVVVLASLMVAVRDWPWRAHYLLTAVAPVLAFSAAALRGDTIDPGMTLSVTLLTTGISMVIVGLLDHRLLIKLMADARTQSDLHQPVSR